MTRAADLASSLVQLADFVTAHPELVECDDITVFASLSIYPHGRVESDVVAAALGAFGDRAEVSIDNFTLKVDARLGDATVTVRASARTVCQATVETVEREVTVYRLPNGQALEMTA
jgi:hypothetical protein